MDTFTCTQHGCEIDADVHPETCPVCNNPQNVVQEGIANNGNDETEWADLTKDELIGQLEEWEIEDGWNSRSTKDELIERLEIAELDAEQNANNGDGDPGKAA